jgi:hypothetical protein
MEVLLPGIDVSRDGKLLAFWTPEVFGVIRTESGKLVRKFPIDSRAGNPSGFFSPPKFTPDVDLWLTQFRLMVWIIFGLSRSMEQELIRSRPSGPRRF